MNEPFLNVDAFVSPGANLLRGKRVECTKLKAHQVD